MKTNKIMTALITIVLSFSIGYLAYDWYFQLPGESQKEGQEKPEEDLGFDHFNVLLLGLDGRKGAYGRSDSIILASIDGKTKKVTLLSIPRDTRVKIKGAWDKVNAAFAYGGEELAQETIHDFLGVEIDRYAIVDFKSVVKLADLVGGVEVDVPQRMYVPLEGIDLQPGKQLLDGEGVLAYCRFRYTADGDIDRAKRQQEVLQLVAQKVLTGKNLTQLPDLFEIVKENVETDMTVKEMVALARIAPDVLEKGINTIVLPGQNKKIDGLWYWEADLAALKELLSEEEGNAIAANIR